MDTKRYIFIGDVHGCLTELEQLLSIVEYDKRYDRLIFLGDLVDRGPNSAECVQYVRKLGAECVLGNHDEKLLRYRRHELRKLDNKKYHNPIRYSPEQREAYFKLKLEDFEWLSLLPRFIHIEEINTVALHAGVMTGNHPLYQFKEAYVYCRYVDKDTGKMLHLRPDFTPPENSIFWAKQYEHTYNIVYGHQVVDLKDPYIRTNSNDVKTFGIDTGAVFDGHLTALIMYSDQSYEIKQVKSSCKYKDFTITDKM